MGKDVIPAPWRGYSSATHLGLGSPQGCLVLALPQTDPPLFICFSRDPSVLDIPQPWGCARSRCGDVGHR